MKILCLFGKYAYGDPARGEGYEYANFLPALARLASEVRLFDSFDRSGYRDFADLNLALAREVCAFQPDAIFAVLMHYEVWTETLDLIRQHTPCAVLHWGTDDSWKYPSFSRFIARHVDVHATTDDASLKHAQRDGLDNFLLSQWAASGKNLRDPVPECHCTYDVTFVGSAYGNRREWIEALRARGVDVTCFGHGWEEGVVAANRVPEIFQSSRISLNFGDSGLQISGGGLRRSRQIKARTFEVPGAGGLLVTEDAPELSRYFDVGREVATFADVDALASLIIALLREPERRDAMAWSGYKRVKGEHTYEMRFPSLIEAARGAAMRRGQTRWTLDPSMLDNLVAAHRQGMLLHAAGEAMRRMGGLVLGPRKGPRAVRRALFEAAWRAGGDRVYRASGWPGRLFYAES